MRGKLKKCIFSVTDNNSFILQERFREERDGRIVGLYGVGDNELVNKAFLVTGACQHRGKASTGLTIATTKGIYVHKGLGRIAEVID